MVDIAKFSFCMFYFCEVYFCDVCGTERGVKQATDNRIVMETKEKKKVFTLSEVAAHNTDSDCWLVIDNKVYDVSTFLDQHPGGGDVLVNASGRDATVDFEEVGHSTAARHMRDQYLIGNIEASPISAKATYSDPVTKPKSTPDKSGEFFTIKILQFVIPLVILALAVGYVFLAKKGEPIPKV